MNWNRGRKDSTGSFRLDVARRGFTEASQNTVKNVIANSNYALAA